MEPNTTELPKVRVAGPLSAYTDGFRDELIDAGYTHRTVRAQLYRLAHVSRWLAEQRLCAADLTPEVVERFLLARRAAGCRRSVTVRSLRALVGYLQRVGAAPLVEPSETKSAAGRLLAEYRRYLLLERRLAPRTVRGYVDLAERFLSAQTADGGLELERLTAGEVAGFVVACSRRHSACSMRSVVTALRSLLRFLFVTGRVPRDLRAAVPVAADWRLAPLPRGVEASVVRALFDGCDRSTPLGLRDFAILMLLSRLGLRAAEVAGLRLADVDWRSGWLVVRGKGGRVDRLPLPEDVGAALIDYLRDGRDRSPCEALFLGAHAPAAAMSAHSVVMVPRRASSRAGIAPVGAHRLRHTAASAMLSGGASLAEIAQVLRHQAEETTAIYAKVDRAALDLVVRPWPGSTR